MSGEFLYRAVEWECDIGCYYDGPGGCDEKITVTVRREPGELLEVQSQRTIEAAARLGWHGYAAGWKVWHMCPAHGRSPGRNFRKIYGKGTRRR